MTNSIIENLHIAQPIVDKLYNIYKKGIPNIFIIKEIAEKQFGEDLVDLSDAFEDFLNHLNKHTLGQLGITKLKDQNEYGSYSIDAHDYVNHRGAGFLEYIPDLGIIDYLTPRLLYILEHSDYTYYVTIRFPQVTVSNEFDESTIIRDLYTCVYFTSTGAFMGTRMFRTTFTDLEIYKGYVHSHLPKLIHCSSDSNELTSSHIDRIVDYSEPPCLGTGPLVRVICFLVDHFDEDYWGLYFAELARYVTIESVSGVPYIRMNNLVNGHMTNPVAFKKFVHYDRVNFITELYKQFIAANNLKFAFKNNTWTIANNLSVLLLDFSNFVLTTLNTQFLEGKYTHTDLFKFKTCFCKGVLKADGTLHTVDTTNTGTMSDQMKTSIRNLDGTKLNHRFKGNQLHLTVISLPKEQESKFITIVNPFTFYGLLTITLSIINNEYGKNTTGKEPSDIRFNC